MKLQYNKSEQSIPIELIDLGYTDFVELHLEEGIDYIAYGIMLWGKVVHYLVLPCGHPYPTWYPAYFFIVSEPSIPNNWYFSHFLGFEANQIKCVMGYKELALDVDHYDGLNEREEEAINIFYKRKEEVDYFSDHEN